jgi:hypothetical protein
MRQDYVDYWKTHKPSCVGLSRIGRGRWSIVYSNATSKPACLIWSCLPDRMVTFDKKGIKLKWRN